jgi:hypothetical protein
MSSRPSPFTSPRLSDSGNPISENASWLIGAKDSSVVGGPASPPPPSFVDALRASRVAVASAGVAPCAAASFEPACTYPSQPASSASAASATRQSLREHIPLIRHTVARSVCWEGPALPRGSVRGARAPSRSKNAVFEQNLLDSVTPNCLAGR